MLFDGGEQPEAVLAIRSGRPWPTQTRSWPTQTARVIPMIPTYTTSTSVGRPKICLAFDWPTEMKIHRTAPANNLLPLHLRLSAPLMVPGAHQSQQPKRHLDRFSHFFKDRERDQQTGRPADDGTTTPPHYSACSVRPLAAMQPNNICKAIPVSTRRHNATKCGWSVYCATITLLYATTRRRRTQH